MKKHILTLIVLLSFAAIADAQKGSQQVTTDYGVTSVGSHQYSVDNMPSLQRDIDQSSDMTTQPTYRTFDNISSYQNITIDNIGSSSPYSNQKRRTTTPPPPPDDDPDEKDALPLGDVPFALMLLLAAGWTLKRKE